MEPNPGRHSQRLVLKTSPAHIPQLERIKMSKHLSTKTLIISAAIVGSLISSMGSAAAQTVQPNTVPSATQAQAVANHLAVDPETGRFTFDAEAASTDGLSENEAREIEEVFETLAPIEVAEINTELKAPIGSTHAQLNRGLTPYAHKAHCDRQYARDSARCRRIPLAQARAICWAAAAVQYANCRR